jgi:hypothetical protein
MLNDDGTIAAVGGPLFAGMRRFDCRNKIVAEMEARGLYRGSRPNPMRLAYVPLPPSLSLALCVLKGWRYRRCSRSGDVIEPLLKPQWWVAMKEPAAAAADVRLSLSLADVCVTDRCAGCAAGRARDPARVPQGHVVPLDGQLQGLVHLAPAVVGPPRAGLPVLAKGPAQARRTPPPYLLTGPSRSDGAARI